MCVCVRSGNQLEADAATPLMEALEKSGIATLANIEFSDNRASPHQ